MAFTAQQMLEKARDGRVFTVEFVKRTTGEWRTMTCRRGVKKGVTGVGMAYDPLSRGLFTVYDMQKKAFRHINLKDLRALVMDGKRYEWTIRGFELVA